MKRWPSSNRLRRTGNVLVFFAMILFGIMAMAALVIDVGFARLTQRQMQTAVDAAAIEGLRFRDELPPGYDPSTDRDDARRQQASDIVTWTFDDDFDTTNGDDFNFGAGPRIVLGPGIDQGGTINAGQFISDPDNPSPDANIGSLPDPPVYKPTRSDGTTRGLELNSANAIHGDMVAGAYNPDADHHDENKNYVRSDFPTPTPDDTAFLVRMRRSNDFEGLDSQANISSHGSAVPYLFGRGAFLPAADPSAGYSPRHHGMTIRGTAIAEMTPALSIGVPVSVGSAQISGSLGIAVERTEFTSWDGVTPIPAANSFQSTARVIGDSVSASTSSVVSKQGFIGLFDDFGVAMTPDRRIVAFGFASVDSAGDVTPDYSKFISSDNVSGVPIRTIDPNAPTSQIISIQKTLRGVSGIVHAAVSVR